MTGMKRLWKFVALAAVVVVAAGGFAFYWFWVRDDAPPEATLRDRPAATTTSGGDGATTTSGAAPGATGADGTWTVAPDPEEVFVGYRVDELFAGDSLKKTAVGRTPAVDGQITIAGDQVTDGSFTADLTQLTSDQSRRDNYIKGSSLQTDEFPEATFELTEPVDLGGAPRVGTQIDVTAKGELTLHGVTKPVTIPLQARWNGDTIDVLGKIAVQFSDFGIEKPSVAILSTDDHGVMEVKLSFERA
jgi:polyisoprenoid-binding protein YceI